MCRDVKFPPSSEPQPPPEHCSSLNLKPNSPEDTQVGRIIDNLYIIDQSHRGVGDINHIKCNFIINTISIYRLSQVDRIGI